MTMVNCLFCHHSFHVSGGWAITFEEYHLSEGSPPEVGICENCWNERTIEEIPPEEISRIDDKIIREFEKTLAGEIGDQKGERVFLESELSESEAMAIKLKDEGLILKRWE